MWWRPAPLWADFPSVIFSLEPHVEHGPAARKKCAKVGTECQPEGSVAPRQGLTRALGYEEQQKQMFLWACAHRTISPHPQIWSHIWVTKAIGVLAFPPVSCSLILQPRFVVFNEQHLTSNESAPKRSICTLFWGDGSASCEMRACFDHYSS